MTPAGPCPWLLVALGLVIGADSALCGIGGGVFAVPLLHYVWRVPLREAVAHSLLLVCASTTSATLSELVRDDGRLQLALCLPLIAGSFVGSRLGFALATRLPERAIKVGFALFLLGAALHVFFSKSAAAAFELGAPETFTPSFAATVALVAIGAAAGASAPLFGIGGGLVCVPLLLMSFQALGFPTARASSMAASAVAAWLGVWLYRRSGTLRGATGLWLALGALAGGLVGVELAHVETAVRLARILLGLTLVFALARLAYDLRANWRARVRPADGMQRGRE